MATQEYIDDLIQLIDTAEDKESVTNQMVATVFDFLNKKMKKEEERHVTLTENEYEKLVQSGKTDPDSLYMIYEDE